MDIRKTKPITIEKKIIKDNLEEEYQIKTDSLLENRRINESIIFNLVQKIQTFEEIRFSYFKTVTSLTNSTYALRSKIHSVAVPGVFVLSSFLLYYKKRGNIYNFAAILCLCSLVNEGAKYHYMRKNEPEASQKYAEFSENYKILMKNYTRAITWRQMLNILLGIDLEKINFDFIRNLFKRKMNEEFSEEYILSKYI